MKKLIKASEAKEIAERNYQGIGYSKIPQELITEIEYAIELGKMETHYIFDKEPDFIDVLNALGYNAHYIIVSSVITKEKIAYRLNIKWI